MPINLNTSLQPVVSVQPDYVQNIIPAIELIGSGATETQYVSGSTWIVFSPDMSTGQTGTFVTKADFNTYTGTTAPLSYLPIDALSGYWTSAQTQSAITQAVTGITGGTGTTASWATLEGQPTDNADLMLLFDGKSNTGHTHNQYLTITVFSGYTGSTQQELQDISQQILEISGITSGLTGTYVEISTFTGYTDVTAPQTYAVILHNHNGVYSPVLHTHDQYSTTAHTHTGVYSPVNHNHSYLNLTDQLTFTPSGATQIQQNGSNVIIYTEISSGGTSGSTYWSEILSKPQWISPLTLNDFQSAHAHSQYQTVAGLTGITLSQSQVTDLVSDLSDLQTEINNLAAIQSNDKLLIFEHTSSDIGGYETLSPIPTQNSLITETVPLTLVGGETLIDPYISPALSITGISAGIWTGHFHAYVSSITGGRLTYMRFKAYKRTAGGVETLLFTTADFLINTTTVKEYQASMALPTYSGWTATDRLVFKVYAQSNNTTTLYWLYNNVSTTAYITVPIITQTAPLWINIEGVPQWLDYTLKSDFQTGHTHAYSSLSGLPNLNLYSLTGHTHVISNVTGLQSALDGKSSTGHTHATLYAPIIHYHSQYLTGVTSAQITGVTQSLYSPIAHLHTGVYSPVAHLHTGVYSPTGHTHATLYAPLSHTHTIANVTGLQTALDAKSSTGHTHTGVYSPVAHLHTGVYSPTGHTHATLYAALSHTHTIANVTNLQTSLDAKTDKAKTISAKSTTYQVASTDADTILECNGTFTVTFPNGLATGFRCDVINVGTGVITLAATTTLNSKLSYKKLASQWGGASVYHRGSNVFVAVGDLTA